ncbi:hypothetical protein [Glycomyces algeriensis]|uniref:Uncharacterized protein n=1 Tax=Glycomyces algeriensis TaxID=256037 RepID=A0A9W6G6U4_9ACTN|nr:hypothetical protein [Glycomyces algeriensis]MDA1366311.1 hypothetical protein [Glycomyces algeriensis]MDR7348656.1 hypothetical protein [Glycomyces algeriensis]GLI41358.1 hypothetical protein GALLR39Z86_12080 [Glycomyces algeriensis]
MTARSITDRLKPGPGRRWNAALLNLSGLSLGFFHLRRYQAGVWHLAATAALSAIFAAGAVASNPGLWLGLAVLWLGWMAFYAWRIGGSPVPPQGPGSGSVKDVKRSLIDLISKDPLDDDVLAREEVPEAAAPARPSWTMTAVGAVLLAALVVGVLALRGAANDEFEAALAAHETGDCVAAEGHYDRIDLRYQLSFSGVLPLAAQDREQCAVLVEARQTASEGEYRATVEAYQAYLAFADAPGEDIAREELAEVHRAEAAALTEDPLTAAADYTAAIGIHALLADEFGDTDAGLAAPEAVQAMYDDAVASATAVGKCEQITVLHYFQRVGWSLELGDDATVAALTAAAVEDAAARLPGILLDCGDDAYARGDRTATKVLLGQLVTTVPDDPNTPAAQAILDDIAAQEAREAEEERQRQEEEAAEREREAEEAAEQARIDEIREEIADASSGGDNLADPDPAGSTGGSMELAIGNSSGYTLEILYDGPETGSFTIGGCDDCAGQCTDGWAVWETVSLPAGEYEMVVKATDEYVTPYYGVWDLDSGTAYEECYYIETY